LIPRASADTLRKWKQAYMSRFRELLSCLSDRKTPIATLAFSLLIITLPFGSYLLPINFGGYSIFAFRAILILTFIVVVITKNIKFGIGDFSKWLSIIFLIWLVYAACSLLWVADHKTALEELFYIFTGLALHLCMISLFPIMKKGSRIFAYSWIIGFFAIIIIALAEIVTKYHLPSYTANLISRLSVNHRYRSLPIATFGNPNNLSIYLTFSFSLFIFLFQRNLYRGISTVAIFIIVFLVTKSESRLGTLTIVCQFVVFLIVTRITAPSIKFPIYRKGKKAAIISLILVTIVYGSSLLPNIQLQLGKISSTDPAPAGSTKLLAEDQSAGTRLAMIRNGLHFFKLSRGVGIGAGNFNEYMRTGRGIYGVATNGFGSRQLDPHNYYIEVLSQYGVLIFALFAIWFSSLVYFSVKLFTTRFLKSVSATRFIFLITLLMSYIMMANVQSRFIPNPFSFLIPTVLSMYADMINRRFTIFKNGKL
jgi:teichuronic acid biosynthesis protein TuaE